MRHFYTILTAALLLAVSFDAAVAQPASFGLNLEARWRGESDGRDFSNETNMYHSSVLRSRLGLWAQQEDIRGYLQFQHPHTLRWNSANLAVDNSVDVHQAYLEVGAFLAEDLTLKIGRSEMKYGDERLIGAVGWSNIGRTFDGIFLHYTMQENWVDVFYTNQGGPGTANEPNDLFAGIWGRYAPLNLEGFFLHRNQTDFRFPDGAIVRVYPRSTVGLHYQEYYREDISTTLNVAYQFGSRRTWDATATIVDYDISAWMVAWQLWYQTQLSMNPSFGIGVDVTSGDEDGTDTKINSFDDLYYTGHKFRGHMDLFVASTLHGLLDFFVGVRLTPADRLTCSLTYHNFSTMADPSGNGRGPAIGDEFDLDATYALKSNLQLGAGFGYFLTSDSYYGAPYSTSSDNGFWGYLMLSTAFDMGK